MDCRSRFTEGRPETPDEQQHLSRLQKVRFDEHVLPHLDAAYNLARYLMRDPHDAEDAVQDAFLRALRHFDGFRGVNGRAWLLTIVRNTCFTRLHRRGPGGHPVEFEEDLHSAEVDAPGPEADLLRALAGETVREALAGLAAEYREVLVLRELEGLSYKEIAQVAGVPIGTVMSRLARGRGRLLTELEAASKENG